MAKASVSKGPQKGGDESAVRDRILAAAFAEFMKSGYASTSALKIATRARVSKRELYALVGSKQEGLGASARQVIPLLLQYSGSQSSRWLMLPKWRARLAR